jgi:uncharacterized protein (TIGR03067 family)
MTPRRTLPTRSACLVIAALLVAAPAGMLAADDDARERAIRADRELMAGEWRLASVVRDGRRMDPTGMIVTVVNGVDGRWHLLSEGLTIAEGFNGIDPTTTPKTLDLVGVQASVESLRGRQYLGIYDVTADTRRMCFAPAGRPRPDAFTSEPGSGRILVTLERVVFQ